MIRQPVHFDMETQDPDDVMTLAILATHPRVDLMSVSCCPGGSDQIGLVKHMLAVVEKEVLAIGGDLMREKPCVSGFHEKWLGKIKPCAPTHGAAEALEMAVRNGCTLLTGGPLKNLAGLPRFRRWVAQGGFAGDSVVPAEHRLTKFAGRETCPTFNFGGAPKVAEAMLTLDMEQRTLVGKNVCHGVAWDRAFHERVKALPKRTFGMGVVIAGMELYLTQNPDGKKLHDPLAMAVAIEPDVCEFRNVEMYRQKGEWGAKLNADSNTRIAVSVDRERFFNVLTCV